MDSFLKDEIGSIKTFLSTLAFCHAILLMHNDFKKLTFTCSKSTTETLEKSVKYVQN